MDKGQELETKIQQLEEELEKASDLVNQLRYELTQKDALLQNFIELEDENYNGLMSVDINTDDDENTRSRKNSRDHGSDSSYTKYSENYR